MLPASIMAAVANPEKGLDADEMVAIVDETNNKVVSSARRAEMVRPTTALWVCLRAAYVRSMCVSYGIIYEACARFCTAVHMF